MAKPRSAATRQALAQAFPDSDRTEHAGDHALPRAQFRLPSGRRHSLRPTMFTTRPELRGTFGMVASTHWLASATGMAVLEQGGNAFDATVAAGLTLQVVEPHLNGPGGDLPAI